MSNPWFVAAVNPWFVATVVAMAGAAVNAWFSRHWLIGAVVFGVGTPFVMAIGDEIVSGRKNKFIALVLVLLGFLTIPAAIFSAYLTFRVRHSDAEK